MARGGARAGAGRKPKSVDPSAPPKKAKPKRKSPSKAKRKGETTPAEDAHEWLKRAAAEIPDDVEEPEYGARRESIREFHRPEEVALKPGRPTLFKQEFVIQAEKLCRLGATDVELADFFEVTTVTIWRWAHSHEDFCNALRTGKEACDERVERSLYNRAVGYSHDAVKIFMPAGAPAPVYAPFVEHVPPDVAAASLWLRNRRGATWRDKQEILHSFNPEQMSDADLADIAAGRGQGVAAPARNPLVSH